MDADAAWPALIVPAVVAVLPAQAAAQNRSAILGKTKKIPNEFFEHEYILS